MLRTSDQLEQAIQKLQADLQLESASSAAVQWWELQALPHRRTTRDMRKLVKLMEQLLMHGLTVEQFFCQCTGTEFVSADDPKSHPYYGLGYIGYSLSDL